jgi:hypothetical protein
VNDPSYGLIWVPNSTVVGAHFAPYVTSGHWELDVYDEWVWVSDYPFGEVVFHYGRWVWIDSVGWAWIPGNRYASAWVVWRVPAGEYAYVGWAPAPVTFVWISGHPVYCGWYHPVGYVYVSSYYAFSYQPSRYIVRDPLIRRRLATQTRRLPANPTTARRPAAPTLDQARVPRAALPTTRRPAALGTAPPRSLSGAASNRAGAGARQPASALPGRTASSARQLPAPNSARRAVIPSNGSRSATPLRGSSPNWNSGATSSPRRSWRPAPSPSNARVPSPTVRHGSPGPARSRRR